MTIIRTDRRRRVRNAATFVAASLVAQALMTCVPAWSQSTMRLSPRLRGNMSSGGGDCSTSHVRLCDGCRLNVTMRVASGKTCHLSLASPRPLLAHSLASRPAHGRYGSANVSDAAYQADAGYVGPDSFELSIFRVALDNQKARETKMRVTVDVVP